MTPLPTKTQRSAGGVILDREGRVVLTSRRSFQGQLQWGLPKGLVEPGEEIEATALREAAEESGLEVALVAPIEVIEYWYVQPASSGRPAVRIHKYVHFFLMRRVGGDPARHDAETEEVAFLDLAEAAQRASFESEGKLLAAVAGALAKLSVRGDRAGQDLGE
ncbi:MAG: NUDIX hydrolase [Actinomycetota bacterium]